MKQLFGKALFAVSVVTFAGCAFRPGDDETADSGEGMGGVVRQEVFETTAGGQVKITLDEENGVTVSILQPAMSDSVLEAYQRREADLVDLYLGLTHEREVPTAILELNQQYTANLEKGKAEAASAPLTEEAESSAPSRDEHAGASETPAGLGLTYNPMTTQQFIDTRCYDEWDYNFCYPTSTDSWNYSRTAFSMHSFAYSYRGTFDHRIQNKKAFGDWKTREANRVAPGYLSSVDRVSDGLFGNMRTGVWDAGGDGYHISVYGTK